MALHREPRPASGLETECVHRREGETREPGRRVPPHLELHDRVRIAGEDAPDPRRVLVARRQTGDLRVRDQQVLRADCERRRRADRKLRGERDRDSDPAREFDRRDSARRIVRGDPAPAQVL